MTILYVITQGEQGGAQLYVKTLARAGQKENHRVIAAIGEDGDGYLRQELEQLDIEVIGLKNLKRSISPLGDLAGAFELASLYKKIKPDIIHLNSTKAGILGAFASALSRRQIPRYKLIYTVHGWVFNENLPLIKKSFFKFLEKATARWKDKIICVSDYDRFVALANKTAPAGKLVTIHNGLDAEINFLERPAARKKLFKTAPAEEEIIAGCIANFYPTKGLNYLIEAAKNLAENKTRVKIVIIGDGDLRLALEEQIKKNNLTDSVILVGKINEASRYLTACDLAVLPSIKEGFPYFLLEAMVAGLPIVATKVGGVPEIVSDGQTGFLVEAKNAQALAEKITLLAEDSRLRQKFGQAGLAKVKTEFSQEKMIQETFAQY